MAEDSCFAEVLVRFFKIIFCPTGWFILKQLDNSPSGVYERWMPHHDYLVIDRNSDLLSYC